MDGGDARARSSYLPPQCTIRLRPLLAHVNQLRRLFFTGEWVEANKKSLLFSFCGFIHI